MNQGHLLNSELLRVLACPWDYTGLWAEDGSLLCQHGHRFGIEEGIPVFTNNPRRERVPRNMPPCAYLNQEVSIDPFVNDWLVNTNGNLYWRARGRLRRYPVPDWPVWGGEGKLLVDVGCGWGRWTIAAARAGFRPIGLDIHMDALAASFRVSRQMGVRPEYVCGHADHLPFRSASIDFVFSYSVLQHLERSTVMRFWGEVSRVLKPGGVCLVQIPNAFGIYNMLRQLKRGFREAKADTFEMRYWSRAAIRRAAEGAGLGKLKVRAEGFFTQNPQISDLDLLSPAGKLIVLASNAGRKMTTVLPVLTSLADSLWVEARALR